MKLVRFQQKENFLRNNKRLVIEDGDDSLHKTHLDDRLKILGHIQHLKEKEGANGWCSKMYDKILY